MAQFILIALTLFITPALVVRFSFSPARSAIPAGYFRVAAIAVVICIGFLWGITAFVPNEGIVPISRWSSNEMLRWLGMNASASILALFVPILVAYGLVRKLTRRVALAWSIPLGLLSVVSFGFFSTGLTCLVFFSC